jgi:ATP-binding cassette, subfamily B, bacterial PglK
MFTNLKSLFLLLTPSQRKNLFLLQFLVILMSFAEIASVFSIGPFMALIGNLEQLHGDSFLAKAYEFSGISNENNFVIAFGLAVIFILIFSALLSTFTLWRLAMYGARVGSDLGNRLFSYYMSESWLFHAQANSSDFINKISVETTRVTGSIILQLMYLNAKMMLALFLSLTIFIFNPSVALSGALIFFLAYFFIYRLAKRQLAINGKKISQENQSRLQLMSEGFGGIKEILLLGRQQLFNKRFFDASNNFFNAWGNSQVLSSVPRYFMELIAFSSAVLLVMFLIIANQNNLSSILPMVSIYALAGFKLLPAFQQIYFSISTIQGNIASYDNLKIDLQSSAKKSLPDWQYLGSKITEEKIEFQSSIQLSNITFGYPETSKPLITNLTIKFPKNQVIGLVGPSGSGKSTIIDILMGLVDPDSGFVGYDEKILKLHQKRALQNKIGFVSQAIYLADTSIKENIAFGIPPHKINNQKIANAIKLANLIDVIQSLPDGINTLVGERGVQLSGGQRQRIGIARSLYNDPEILVFDEATSSLDGLTEKLIMEAIDSFAGKKTIILIAHRLSTVKNCNLIYFIDKGQVTDKGTYQHLITTNSSFKKMSENF